MITTRFAAVLLALWIAFPSNSDAAPLIEVSATATEHYPGEPLDAIRDRARKAALAQAPTRHTRVSTWEFTEHTKVCPYCEPTLKSTARATFVPDSAFAEDWTIRITGVHSVFMVDGSLVNGEWEYSIAEQNALQRLEWACGERSRFHPPIALVAKRNRTDDLLSGYGTTSTFQIEVSGVCRRPPHGPRP